MGRRRDLPAGGLLASDEGDQGLADGHPGGDDSPSCGEHGVSAPPLVQVIRSGQPVARLKIDRSAIQQSRSQLTPTGDDLDT